MQTVVLHRGDWTAANVLALGSEGFSPLAADRDLIVFGKVDEPVAFRSQVHDDLVVARERLAMVERELAELREKLAAADGG